MTMAIDSQRRKQPPPVREMAAGPALTTGATPT